MNEYILPSYLDDLVFKQLGGIYAPSGMDISVIDWSVGGGKNDINAYLGTYFPRSYAESMHIFSLYFEKHKFIQNRESLSVFDFGCGTGGEIIGLLSVLDRFPNLKSIEIKGLDGNQGALRLCEKIVDVYQKQTDKVITFTPAPIFIEDFYDLSILDKCLPSSFDIIMSFKAVCEFVTKDVFNQENPYKHIADFMFKKLNPNGIILLEDVTTKNSVFNQWLPVLMEQGLSGYKIVEKNKEYNETIYVSHSRKTDDKSKIAWRIINN